MSCSTDPSVEFDQLISKYETEYPEATIGIVAHHMEDGLTLQKNSARVFHAASVMKIPVMIEVYKQAKEGRFALSDSIDIVNEFQSIVDQSSYTLSLNDDSDDKIYSHIGKKMTIADLNEKMITVSSNLATNILINLVGADRAQATTESLGAKRMKVLRGVEDLEAFKKGVNNTITAGDITEVLKALANGSAIDAENDQAMIEVLKKQEFNEMIPKYLPEGYDVAHKTGQITAIHHDAGIVFPTTGSPFILAILIEGLNDDTESSELGARIAEGISNIFAD